MSTEDNKAIVGRWFDQFWGREYNLDVIDELAAPDIRFEYSMHAPCKGREEVRKSPPSSAPRFRISASVAPPS